jgi:O-methyltransferase
MQPPADLYLDLLKRCLTNFPYGDDEAQPVPREQLPSPWMATLAECHGLKIVRPAPFLPGLRAAGLDCPPTAHTLLGLRRLDLLHACTEDALARGVPGDLVEAGAWRGGAAVLLRGVLKARGDAGRTVWVADSFRGLPPPSSGRHPREDTYDPALAPRLVASLEEVRRTFERYGLLDGQVRFLEGWFRDTLPSAPPGPLALAHLDATLYSSTLEALTHLYPRLSVGGYLIVEDYAHLSGPGQAVLDYRTAHGITEGIRPLGDDSVYWCRER